MLDARLQRSRRTVPVHPESERLCVLQRPRVLDQGRIMLAPTFEQFAEFEPGLVILRQLGERTAQQRFRRGPVASERGAPGIS